MRPTEEVRVQSHDTATWWRVWTELTAWFGTHTKCSSCRRCAHLCSFETKHIDSRRFAKQAPYLFDPTAPGLAEYDSGLRTIECTKRAAAFGLWGIWSIYGQQLFTDLVDVTFALGKIFYEKLDAAPDFRPLHEPQCNIVVFRHVPEALQDVTDERLGKFQLDLRRRIIESGEFYIVSTKLDDVGALRTTIINPLTTPDDLDQLLESLRRHGRDLLKDGHGYRDA